LASTPNVFIPMNVISTVIGSIIPIKMLLRRCMTMSTTTMIVTKTCCSIAEFSVCNVS
jgi:hypothetical protein